MHANYGNNKKIFSNEENGIDLCLHNSRITFEQVQNWGKRNNLANQLILQNNFSEYSELMLTLSVIFGAAQFLTLTHCDVLQFIVSGSGGSRCTPL
jgi:hypothetical protein